MVGVRQVQYGITEHHHQLFVLATERTGQWLVGDFSNYPRPYPLPELRLSGPELLLVILTDDQGVILFSLLLVFSCFQHGGFEGTYRPAKVRQTCTD